MNGKMLYLTPPHTHTQSQKNNLAASANFRRYDSVFLYPLMWSYIVLLYSSKAQLTQYYNVIIYNCNVDNRKRKENGISALCSEHIILCQ